MNKDIIDYPDKILECHQPLVIAYLSRVQALIATVETLAEDAPERDLIAGCATSAREFLDIAKYVAGGGISQFSIDHVSALPVFTGTVAEIIDQMKSAMGLATDAELAEILEIEPSAIAQWKKRDRVPERAKRKVGQYMVSGGRIATMSRTCAAAEEASGRLQRRLSGNRARAFERAVDRLKARAERPGESGPMNAKRVQLVQVARRKLGLDEASYRAILRDYGGADSAKALDDRGFSMVMDRFRYLGFVSDQRKMSFSVYDRIGMASTGQVALIRELWSKLSKDGSSAALDKWISRFGVDALRFVDDRTAIRIIGALRKWDARPTTSRCRDDPEDG